MLNMRIFINFHFIIKSLYRNDAKFERLDERKRKYTF